MQFPTTHVRKYTYECDRASFLSPFLSNSAIIPHSHAHCLLPIQFHSSFLTCEGFQMTQHVWIGGLSHIAIVRFIV